MPKKKKKKITSIKGKAPSTKALSATKKYQTMLLGIKELIQQAQYGSARAVNAIMTATYWEIGRRIIEVEQKGQKRANYGERLISKLAKDLCKSCGKGFGQRNLKNARLFYLTYSHLQKGQTLSAQSQKGQMLFAKSFKALKTKESSEFLIHLSQQFPLPWSAYIRLLSVKDVKCSYFL